MHISEVRTTLKLEAIFFLNRAFLPSPPKFEYTLMVTIELRGIAEMAINSGKKMIDSMSNNSVIFWKHTGFQRRNS